MSQSYQSYTQLAKERKHNSQKCLLYLVNRTYKPYLLFFILIRLKNDKYLFELNVVKTRQYFEGIAVLCRKILTMD